MTGEVFNETEFVLADEVDRLAGEIESVREKVNETEPGSDQEQRLSQRLQNLRTQKVGAEWARGYPDDDDSEGAFADDDFPMWDEDVDSVTLGAVLGGAWSDLKNELGANEMGSSALLMIADGTVDAPYIDEDMDDIEAVGVVRGLHPYYLEWAENRVTELMNPRGNAER